MNKLYNGYTKIWQCQNPSKQTLQMQNIVKEYLRILNVEYTSDSFGNIFAGNFDESRPCLVSHLDSVHTKKPKKIIQSGNMLTCKTGIGADDKAGIVAILEILAIYDNINAIFTIDEEIGGIGASKINANILKNVCYFIEIDRKGNSDCVETSGDNNIAGDDFVKALASYKKKYGFKTAEGTYTDVNELTQISKKCAINVSAGYYNAHSNHEYIDLNELQHSIDFILDIISNVRDTFDWKTSNIIQFISEYDYINYGNVQSIESILATSRNKLSRLELFHHEIEDIINLIEDAYESGVNDSLMCNSENEYNETTENWEYQY